MSTNQYLALVGLLVIPPAIVWGLVYAFRRLEARLAFITQAYGDLQRQAEHERMVLNARDSQVTGLLHVFAMAESRNGSLTVERAAVDAVMSGAGLCVRMRDGSYLGRRPDGPKSFIE